MAEEKPLYPLRFAAEETVRKPWGGETYKVADLGFADSVVLGGWLGGNTLGELMETYLERLVGETAFEWYGTQFPVQVKLLDLRGRTPLWVNVDDETAAQRYDAFGKTALWYVAETGPASKLFLGWNRELPAAELYERSLAGSLDEVLHAVVPEKGDSFLIAPGTVYAAQGPLKIIEIAESSECCFRLDTELEEAFDLIDLRAFVPGEEPKDGDGVTERLADCPQFRITRIRLDEPLQIRSGETDSFALYACAAGAASVQLSEDGQPRSYDLGAGEALLIPAGTGDYFLLPREKDTLLLETLLPERGEEPQL